VPVLGEEVRVQSVAQGGGPFRLEALLQFAVGLFERGLRVVAFAAAHGEQEAQQQR